MSKDKKNNSEESLKDQTDEILDNPTEEPENKEDNKDDFSETDQLRENLGKERDKFLRLFAEFENYKKRTGKERLELFKTANQDMMVALLPILDDFDRALSEMLKANDKELIKGVELIHSKFRETLRSKGLELMEVKEGEPFDSELHEAITQIPAPSEELKGKVIDVVQKGYKLGDRIIRYPKVVTGM